MKEQALIETFKPHINHSVGTSKVLLIMFCINNGCVKLKEGIVKGRIKPSQ